MTNLERIDAAIKLLDEALRIYGLRNLDSEGTKMIQSTMEQLTIEYKAESAKKPA